MWGRNDESGGVVFVQVLGIILGKGKGIIFANEIEITTASLKN